jgi:hypothetical protein
MFLVEIVAELAAGSAWPCSIAPAACIKGA